MPGTVFNTLRVFTHPIITSNYPFTIPPFTDEKTVAEAKHKHSYDMTDLGSQPRLSPLESALYCLASFTFTEVSQ